MDAVTVDRDPVVMMLRAEITRPQLKALRAVALEMDTTMQALLGGLIASFLAERQSPKEGK